MHATYIRMSAPALLLYYALNFSKSSLVIEWALHRALNGHCIGHWTGTDWALLKLEKKSITDVHNLPYNEHGNCRANRRADRHLGSGMIAGHSLRHRSLVGRRLPTSRCSVAPGRPAQVAGDCDGRPTKPPGEQHQKLRIQRSGVEVITVRSRPAAEIRGPQKNPKQLSKAWLKACRARSDPTQLSHRE